MTENSSINTWRLNVTFDAGDTKDAVTKMAKLFQSMAESGYPPSGLELGPDYEMRLDSD